MRSPLLLQLGTGSYITPSLPLEIELTRTVFFFFGLVLLPIEPASNPLSVQVIKKKKVDCCIPFGTAKH